MRLHDNKHKPLIEGIFKAEKLVDGQWLEVTTERNLVVDGAITILRDLMFGDNPARISKIIFGDQNLDPEGDVLNVPPADPTDTGLTNKLYEKAVTKTKITYNGNPAIEYVVILNDNEFNGTGSQLITEYALANDNDEIFTIKTRAGIFKDDETTLKFTWTLAFS